MSVLLPFSAYKAFVDACVESPDDYNPRLVLADFLEEWGDPRAPLLRLTHVCATAKGLKPVTECDPDVGPYGYPSPFVPYTPWFHARFLASPEPTRPRPSWARLWGLACVRDAAVGRWGTAIKPNAISLRVCQVLLRYELYACRLVDPFYRDQLGTFPHRYMFGLSVPYRVTKGLASLRSGPPGRAVAAATWAGAICVVRSAAADGRYQSLSYRRAVRDRQQLMCDAFLKALDTSGFDPARLAEAEKAFKLANPRPPRRPRR